jgi:hypothetical protein
MFEISDVCIVLKTLSCVKVLFLLAIELSFLEIIVNIMPIHYSRRGQSEARGPHAARQRFFAALAANLNDLLIRY